MGACVYRKSASVLGRSSSRNSRSKRDSNAAGKLMFCVAVFYKVVLRRS